MQPDLLSWAPSRKTMKPPKGDKAYRSAWRLAWGAVVDTINSHPDYFVPARRNTAVISITKRVAGAFIGFAEQSAKGRSAKAAAVIPATLSDTEPEAGFSGPPSVAPRAINGAANGVGGASSPPNTILGDRDGATFSRSRDGVRLNEQCQDVFNFLSDNCWHTLREISEKTKHPEASISARIRDLRKPKFGGFKIEKRYVGNGVWQYRMVA